MSSTDTKNKIQELEAANPETTPPPQSTVQKFQASDDKAKFVKDVEEKKDKNAEEFEFLAAVYNTGVKEFKIEANKEKAAEYLEKGAGAGSTACMISYGEQNMEKDGAKSKAMLEGALSMKDYRAANALGVMYMKLNDINSAIAKFELADSHNVPNAKQNVCVSKLQKVMIGLSESLALLRDVMAKQG